MKVELAADVFNHSGSFLWLDRILYLILDGRHEWSIPNPGSILNSKWYANLGHIKDTFKELFEKSMTRSLNNGRFQKLVVTLAPDGLFQLQPEQAYRYLDKPFLIIVENTESDGAFLELVLAKFAKRALGSRHFSELFG